jgi:hypothetical protein
LKRGQPCSRSSNGCREEAHASRDEHFDITAEQLLDDIGRVLGFLAEVVSTGSVPLEESLIEVDDLVYFDLIRFGSKHVAFEDHHHVVLLFGSLRSDLFHGGRSLCGPELDVLVWAPGPFEHGKQLLPNFLEREIGDLLENAGPVGVVNEGETRIGKDHAPRRPAGVIRGVALVPEPKQGGGEGHRPSLSMGRGR